MKFKLHVFRIHFSFFALHSTVVARCLLTDRLWPLLFQSIFFYSGSLFSFRFRCFATENVIQFKWQIIRISFYLACAGLLFRVYKVLLRLRQQNANYFIRVMKFAKKKQLKNRSRTRTISRGGVVFGAICIFSYFSIVHLRKIKKWDWILVLLEITVERNATRTHRTTIKM